MILASRSPARHNFILRANKAGGYACAPGQHFCQLKARDAFRCAHMICPLDTPKRKHVHSHLGKRFGINRIARFSRGKFDSLAVLPSRDHAIEHRIGAQHSSKTDHKSKTKNDRGWQNFCDRIFRCLLRFAVDAQRASLIVLTVTVLSAIEYRSRRGKQEPGAEASTSSSHILRSLGIRRKSCLRRLFACIDIR